MKKSDLKNLVKPIVKECIREMVLEEGVLSSLIKEVLKAQPPQAIVKEARFSAQEEKKELSTNKSHDNKNKPASISAVIEARKRLAESIGIKGVFEGTTPAPSPDSLVGEDGGDPGIDLKNFSNMFPGMKIKK